MSRSVTFNSYESLERFRLAPAVPGHMVNHTGHQRSHGRGRPLHELSITQSVVDAVCARAAGRPVRSVRIQVGRLTGVVPAAMRFCFELVAEGTVLEGAGLEIEQPAARAHCRTCGADFTLPDPILLCPCGSADVEVTAGRELQILSMEVS
jgi:hydrogenase nickel incorporation protein HypA/HybF